MIGEYQRVALTNARPEHGLSAGTIGTVVMVHNGGEGFTIEFNAADGSLVALPTLMADEVRLATTQELARLDQTRAASAAE